MTIDCIGPYSSIQVSVGSSFDMNVGTGFVCCFRDNVDCPYERRSPIDSSCWAFENFNPFYLADIHWHIQCEMASLRVANVDSVEQYSYLVECATSDADIGLHSFATSLSHIHSYCIF